MAQTTETAVFVERRRPGRPRCSQVEWTIKRAALELMELQGFTNLTIEGVAARAGVGKATIYRWWPTKAHLAVQAFLDCASYQIPEPDSGCVRTDVIDQLCALATLFAGSEGKIISAFIGAAQENSELSDILKREWLERRRRITFKSLELGQERGQIRADIDLELLLDTLVGPLYIALLMKHRSIDEIDIDAHVANVFAGAAAPLG